MKVGESNQCRMWQSVTGGTLIYWVRQSISNYRLASVNLINQYLIRWHLTAGLDLYLKLEG